MAEYRRFVAYVYEYQKEKKGSNCGFVKIEVRGEICRIELHLQCPGLMPESTCSVYGFVRNRELLDGILLGGCVTGEGKVECILEISAGNMGDSGKSLDEMGGMIFVTEQGGFFGTEWDDQMIRPGNFRVVEKKMIPETQPDLSETERSSEEEIAESKQRHLSKIGMTGRSRQKMYRRKKQHSRNCTRSLCRNQMPQIWFLRKCFMNMINHTHRALFRGLPAMLFLTGS